nr:hypothetical protein [uncultured Cohaesibacter sp.]
MHSAKHSDDHERGHQSLDQALSRPTGSPDHERPLGQVHSSLFMTIPKGTAILNVQIVEG